VFIPLVAALFLVAITGCTGTFDEAPGGWPDTQQQAPPEPGPDTAGDPRPSADVSEPDVIEAPDLADSAEPPGPPDVVEVAGGDAEIADSHDAGDTDAIDASDAIDAIDASDVSDVSDASEVSVPDEPVCGAVVEVEVTGGDPLTQPWSDLTLEGQGFEAYEGREIHLRVASSLGPFDLTGQGTAVVACGSFAFFAPEQLEYGVYKNLVLLIDENGNGACDDGVDTVWSMTTSAIGGDLELQMTATSPLWQGGFCWAFF